MFPRVSWHIWVSSTWLINLQVGFLDVIGTGDYVHYTTTNRTPELAIITWSQVTQSHEWMERPENSSKGQSNVCLLTQLEGQKLKPKISIIAFCQIQVRFSDSFFFKDMPCIAMWYVMSKYSWRFWFLWFFLCIMHPRCMCLLYILAVPDTHTHKQTLTEHSFKKASANIQILANIGDYIRRIN